MDGWMDGWMDGCMDTRGYAWIVVAWMERACSIICSVLSLAVHSPMATQR